MNFEDQGVMAGEILIVDDQVNNLKLLDQILQKYGYQVRKTLSGSLALQSAISKPPDLILLDIRMEGMDGYEVCRRLKLNYQTRNIPVIFLSALDEPINKVKAFYLGGVDYITKPFQPEEVLIRIKNQLTIKHQQKVLKHQIKRLQEQEQELKQEIKKRQEAEEVIYQSRALLSSIINSSLDCIAALQAIRSNDGEIIDFSCILVNPCLASELGLTKEDLIGKPICREVLSHFEGEIFQHFVQIVVTGNPLETDIQNPETEKYYHVIAVKVGDGFSLIARDITQRKLLEMQLNKSNKKLEKLANFDSLTQVGNRRAFDMFLTRAWAECLKKQQSLAILLIDIDFFKNYNDYYGHLQGDKCLVKIAEILTQSLTPDIGFITRYGGEEFVIICQNQSLETVKSLAANIVSRVQDAKIEHQKSAIGGYLTLSIGICHCIPDSSMKITDLIAQADIALYEAKQQGRARLIWKTL